MTTTCKSAIPQKMVPYLGFLIDSSSEVFRLIPEKKRKFIELIRETLDAPECVSFSLAVPAVRLFTREMSAAISMGIRTLKPIVVQGALRDEIAHWLFLEEWDDPFLGVKRDIFRLSKLRMPPKLDGEGLYPHL